MKNYDDLPIYEKLFNKIYVYGQTIWKDKWEDGIVDEWLENYIDSDKDLLIKEQINVLYLLSKFMYFGNKELRQLLWSLYRDLFKYPIIESIRKENNNSTNLDFINNEFQKELERSRFLGVGNPSESGIHLLYYFRQECKLSKEYFINFNDIFVTKQVEETLNGGKRRPYLMSEIADKNIKRYIFIDDFCGSGSQATGYLKTIVKNIKFENKDIEVNYFMLFATEHGINEVRKLELFNTVDAVYTIDESFRTFSDNSRYFIFVPNEQIEKEFSKNTCLKYGQKLFFPPLGYGNCQLLLGLFHNTPDNTLPIFWSEVNEWKPIFKRYPKF